MLPESASTDPIRMFLENQCNRHFQRIYSKSSTTSGSGHTLYVYQAGPHPSEIVLVHKSPIPQKELKSENHFDVTAGRIEVRPMILDPAFPGLRQVLVDWPAISVLRYRPGKRLTLMGCRGSERFILKMFADDRGLYISQVSELFYQARKALGFAVSRPLCWEPGVNLFTQSYLPGKPVQPLLMLTEAGNNAWILAHQMGVAIATLHASGIRLPNSFCMIDQSRRTKRYCDEIKNRYPVCERVVDELFHALDAIHTERLDSPRSFTPIHGSMHSHQWLVDAGGLSLIDLDRAAMGHPENDVATFITEWEYEPDAIGRPLVEKFVDGYLVSGNLNEDRLRFYRGHKHLAKAFKAARSGVVGSEQKTLRNLNKGLELLQKSSC